MELSAFRFLLISATIVLVTTIGCIRSSNCFSIENNDFILSSDKVSVKTVNLQISKINQRINTNSFPDQSIRSKINSLPRRCLQNRVGKQPAFHRAAAGCAARCVGCAAAAANEPYIGCIDWYEMVSFLYKISGCFE